MLDPAAAELAQHVSMLITLVPVAVVTIALACGIPWVWRALVERLW